MKEEDAGAIPPSERGLKLVFGREDLLGDDLLQCFDLLRCAVGLKLEVELILLLVQARE